MNNTQLKGGQDEMKNIVRTLGLAALLALSNGCKEQREFVIEEPTVEQIGETVSITGYLNRKQTNFVVPSKEFTKGAYSTWRDYPSAGRTKPYIEVKDDFFNPDVKLWEPYMPSTIYLTR